MNDLVAEHEALQRTPRIRLDWVTEHRCCPGCVASRYRSKNLAIEAKQGSERGFTEAHRLFQHRVEDRREVAGRGFDYLQYLGGRGLLVTRFGKLCLTLGKLTFEISYTLLGIG